MSFAGAAEDVVRVRIRGGPDAAGIARRNLSRLCDKLESPTLDNLRLLVTELVTNSVRHTGAEFVDLMVVVTSEKLRVEVTDPGPGFHHSPRQRGLYDEGGWGLVLVERLSQRWGVSRDPGLARVWLELPR